MHAQAALDGDKAAHAAVTPLQFLADKAVADVVQAGAAVAVNVAAEQAEGGELGHQLDGKAVILEGLGDNRQDALVDEPCDRVLHLPLVIGKERADVEEIELGWCGHASDTFTPSLMQIRRSDCIAL